ncbi:UDP-N-acetylmuramoyl-L-alanine--D-glutamate ligase [Pseudomaricurvus albidus]|uniref:UDP-N-acetylmuramoyl-L-alanine--D-glutamate ligase n=1 Tax=Pseudomaricurvus albidus TaxID=2842452 RepID=UPI0034E22365
MVNLIAQSNVIVLVGMGMTGQSAARYLTNSGRRFVWVDTREAPPALDSVRSQFPDANIELGDLKEDTLLAASEIIVSPGVPLSNPMIQKAVNAGVPVLGDIELFLREVKAPVIAITGSNAKSTVTTLVGEMAKAAGKMVLIGGNIGVPVLDLLQQPAAELYVLELSSFQLESVNKLNAEVSTVLNVSEDHMDRYDSFAQYYMAKQRVYFGARKVVINREDPLTSPPLAEGVQQFSFGLNVPDRNGFGVIVKGGQEYLAFEFKALMPSADIKMPGRHNIANALAALALGHAVGLPMESMLQTLTQFPGLPHRCQWVAENGGVNFYNDSKGTNVGATLAALKGLQKDSGKIVLIAGGVGKGADFSSLKDAAAGLRSVVVIGQDGAQIAAQFEGLLPTRSATTMQEAVELAAQQAEAGDDVLLSPACASFDMYKGFEDRGDHFVRVVKEVVA